MLVPAANRIAFHLDMDEGDRLRLLIGAARAPRPVCWRFLHWLAGQGIPVHQARLWDGIEQCRDVLAEAAAGGETEGAYDTASTTMAAAWAVLGRNRVAAHAGFAAAYGAFAVSRVGRDPAWASGDATRAVYAAGRGGVDYGAMATWLQIVT